MKRFTDQIISQRPNEVRSMTGFLYEKYSEVLLLEAKGKVSINHGSTRIHTIQLTETRLSTGGLFNALTLNG